MKSCSHFNRTQYLESQIIRESGSGLAISQSPVDLGHDFYHGLKPNTTKACYLEFHTVSPPSLERMGRKRGEASTSWFVPKVHLIIERNEPEELEGDIKEGALHGRPVSPDRIDWEYVAKWLKICKSRHPRMRVNEVSYGRTPQRPSTSRPIRSLEAVNLLVIDVYGLCVTPLPRDEEYIALSYMWGKDQELKLKKQNTKQLLTPEIFRTITPSRTIVDAMEATRRLGYRYIWVDALCITQDDEQTIQNNVGVMDLIQAEAALTIVAAAGTNADSGLPGVFCDIPRTQQQHTCHIDKITVANMLDSSNDAINFSRWNSRGWTYQERLLSTRLLIFTDAQVYFECHQACQFREDIHMDDGSAVMAPSDVRYHLNLHDGPLFDIYATAVAEYTYRELTSQEDKLRAFGAVLNILVEAFRGPFLFGLPSTVFDVGLLWVPKGACARSNDKFPSWSWAGWDGPVEFAMGDSMTNLCECTVGQVDIETSRKVRLCSRISRLARTQTQWTEKRGEVWRRHIDQETLSCYYTLTNEQGEGYPYRYPRPLKAIGDDEAEKLAAEDLGCLKITGLSACFTVTGQHSRSHALFSTCKEGRHEQCRLDVFDDQDRRVGTVSVDGRVVPQLCGKSNQFLAIARSTLCRMDVDPSWDEETTSFRCWTHPESGNTSELDDNAGLLVNENGINILKDREAFDIKHFNKNIFWPVFDVLLMTDRDNGAVERLGIGKIHVDAFLSIANESCVLLC